MQKMKIIRKRSGHHNHVKDIADQTIRFDKTDIKKSTEANAKALVSIIEEAIVNLTVLEQVAPVPKMYFIKRNYKESKLQYHLQSRKKL